MHPSRVAFAVFLSPLDMGMAAGRVTGYTHGVTDDVFSSLALHRNVSRPTRVTGADVRAAFEAVVPTPAQHALLVDVLTELVPGRMFAVASGCAMAVGSVTKVASTCLPPDDEVLETLDEIARVAVARTVRPGDASPGRGSRG